MTKEVFNKNGYVLLENIVRDVEFLEDITNDFIYLPEAKNKYMKYFEDKNRRLSRMEYLLDFDERLNKFEKEFVRPIAEKYMGEKVDIFKEKINFKLPGGGAFKPHQDFPAWNDFSPTEYITIGIPLDNMTIENGCLYYAKGIGNDKKIYHDKETKFIPEDLVNSWEWYPVICKRNDIIVFNSFVPHKSSVNNTNSFRRIYYFTYNKASEGSFREDYFNKKREVFPQDADKIPGKDYSKIGIKYNLGNPIGTNIINK